MRSNEIVQLISIFLFTHVTYSVSDYEQYSCGSLLGDKRFCLNYTNAGLVSPPRGYNVTNKLILRKNEIRSIDYEHFTDQVMLKTLDISYNKITFIAVKALNRLPLLKEIQLRGNPYHCDFTLCELKTWIMTNRHVVLDSMTVTCHSPPELYGYEVINIPQNVCKNYTNDINGFQINTGTVFLIWIVVPVAITVLVGIYIILNGNNRVGHAFRGGFSRFRVRFTARLSDVWRSSSGASVPPPRYNVTRSSDRNRSSNNDDDDDQDSFNANETSVTNEETRRRDEVLLSRVNINLPQTRSLSLSPDEDIAPFGPTRTAYSDSNIPLR